MCGRAQSDIFKSLYKNKQFCSTLTSLLCHFHLFLSPSKINAGLLMERHKPVFGSGIWSCCFGSLVVSFQLGRPPSELRTARSARGFVYFYHQLGFTNSVLNRSDIPYYALIVEQIDVWLLVWNCFQRLLLQMFVVWTEAEVPVMPFAPNCRSVWREVHQICII